MIRLRSRRKPARLAGRAVPEQISRSRRCCTLAPFRQRPTSQAADHRLMARVIVAAPCGSFVASRTLASTSTMQWIAIPVPVHSNDRDPACASDDTISTDTSADSSRDACDPVSKLPLVHARDIPLSCPRAYGLANTQAECVFRATLYLNRRLAPRIVTTPQETGFSHPLHLPNVAIFRLSGGPSVHLGGSIHGIS